ncbi:MAG: Crp/Fnr family transcriptional regulator [Pseudomonadota bacterium]
MQKRFEKALCTAADLDRIEAFRDLGSAVRQDILAQIKAWRVPAERDIIGYLDQTHSVYFLLEGEVRVNMLAAGGRQITYQILHAGAMFGELAAIDGLPRSASVVSETEVLLAELTREQFIGLARLHPDLSMMIMRRLANLSRWLASRVFEYHTYNVRGRVYLELIRAVEALDNSDGEAFESADTLIKISDRDMASRVGTTRENVTRIYATLKEQNVLSRSGGGIRILSLPALRGLLNDCEFS